MRDSAGGEVDADRVRYSPALSWYLTENVKFVAVVPEPGETDGSVRLPLSGHVTARTGVTNPVKDAENKPARANAPTSQRRRLRRCACGSELPSLGDVEHMTSAMRRP